MDIIHYACNHCTITRLIAQSASRNVDALVTCIIITMAAKSRLAIGQSTRIPTYQSHTKSIKKAYSNSQ